MANLRKIIVNHRTFLWKREHIHLRSYDTSPCVEKITIYLEGSKKSPLRLFFKEDDNKLLENNSKTDQWCLSGNGDGVIWLYKQRSLIAHDVTSINFNRPAIVKELITYFLAHTWRPETDTQPLEINESFKYLDIIDLKKSVAG